MEDDLQIFSNIAALSFCASVGSSTPLESAAGETKICQRVQRAHEQIAAPGLYLFNSLSNFTLLSGNRNMLIKDDVPIRVHMKINRHNRSLISVD